jgi:hypothetical protein
MASRSYKATSLGKIATISGKPAHGINRHKIGSYVIQAYKSVFIPVEEVHDNVILIAELEKALRAGLISLLDPEGGAVLAGFVGTSLAQSAVPHYTNLGRPDPTTLPPRFEIFNDTDNAPNYVAVDQATWRDASGNIT